MAEIDLQAHLAHPHADDRTAPSPAATRSGPLELVLTRGLEAATILVTVAQIVVVAAAVIFRYLLNRPIQGSDEIASLLLIWMTFLAGAIGLRRRLHPSVPLLVSRLPAGAVAHIHSAWAIVAALAVSGFALGLTLPPRDLLVRNATPKGATGRVFGFVYSGLDVGAAIAPVTIGVMLDNRYRAGSLWLMAVSAIFAIGTTIAISTFAGTVMVACAPSVATWREPMKSSGCDSTDHDPSKENTALVSSKGISTCV